LSDLDRCEFSHSFLRSTLDCHLDGTLWTRYLAVDSAFSLRVGRVVTRDYPNVERASGAAVVLLVVDIGLVIDIVAPVAAHASVE